ncbi:MAG: peptidyl-prolyl cis-trans isomerase [Nitrospirae bacterium]|nr:peptidyl-prolyl cis-trans isomerase [Nitrospirota bacterium]
MGVKKLVESSLRPVIILFLIFFIIVLQSKTYATDELRASKVVAEVNGAAITQGELDIATDSLLPSISYHAHVSPEKRKEAEKKALENLINEALFFEEARKQGLKTDKSDVIARLDKIKEKYPSRKAFEEALKKYGISEDDLKEKVKKILLIEKLMEKEVRVSLTDKDIEDYYNKNIGKFMEPETVSLKYIFVKINPADPDSRKKAKAKAREALSKLKSGEDFSKVAWSYSEDMSRVKGGEVGFIHKGRLAPEVEKVAFSMKTGQISGLIENEQGYHIVKVEDRRPSRQIPLDEIKNKLKKELTESYQAKKMEELLKRLKASATIKYY